MDHARKLKFSIYVYLCSAGQVIIFEHGRYISALKNYEDVYIQQLRSSSMYKHNL